MEVAVFWPISKKDEKWLEPACVKHCMQIVSNTGASKAYHQRWEENLDWYSGRHGENTES